MNNQSDRQKNQITLLASIILGGLVFVFWLYSVRDEIVKVDRSTLGPIEIIKNNFANVFDGVESNLKNFIKK